MDNIARQREWKTGTVVPDSCHLLWLLCLLCSTHCRAPSAAAGCSLEYAESRENKLGSIWKCCGMGQSHGGYMRLWNSSSPSLFLLLILHMWKIPVHDPWSILGQLDSMSSICTIPSLSRELLLRGGRGFLGPWRQLTWPFVFQFSACKMGKILELFIFGKCLFFFLNRNSAHVNFFVFEEKSIPWNVSISNLKRS